MESRAVARGAIRFLVRVRGRGEVETKEGVGERRFRLAVAMAVADPPSGVEEDVVPTGVDGVLAVGDDIGGVRDRLDGARRTCSLTLNSRLCASIRAYT